MRISDWSSDVCSSDLLVHLALSDGARQSVRARGNIVKRGSARTVRAAAQQKLGAEQQHQRDREHRRADGDRQNVVKGKSLSGGVDLGCSRSITKKNTKKTKILCKRHEKETNYI